VERLRPYEGDEEYDRQDMQGEKPRRDHAHTRCTEAETSLLSAQVYTPDYPQEDHE
jgi:hypothetical protein